MTADTPATRKARERERKAQAGLKRLEFWVRAESVAAVKKAVQRIEQTAKDQTHAQTDAADETKT